MKNKKQKTTSSSSDFFFLFNKSIYTICAISAKDSGIINMSGDPSPISSNLNRKRGRYVDVSLTLHKLMFRLNDKIRESCVSITICFQLSCTAAYAEKSALSRTYSFPHRLFAWLMPTSVAQDDV